MLSPAAFNALLKTLEEPPPHAKFIFATTEVRKVPVTVLSRCQRFDLRRVEAELLTKHLETIAAKEGVSAEPDALALIARAAEGSVRDALSLLDQAIAHAGSDKAAQVAVRAEDVRQMLGLADRARVVDLFEAMMRGDIAGALRELRDQYDSGADPAVVLADLAEFTHLVTRVKIVPAVAEDRSLSEVERVRGRAFAAGLSMRVLSRTWQMLFRGIPDVQSAPKRRKKGQAWFGGTAYRRSATEISVRLQAIRLRQCESAKGRRGAADRARHLRQFQHGRRWSERRARRRHRSQLRHTAGGGARRGIERRFSSARDGPVGIP
jgi:DNA polymerase III subunit gamma/tau